MHAFDNAFADPKTYGNPQAYYDLLAQMRKEDPVHWTHPDGIRPFWLVTKHADIVEVERHNDVFINAPRVTMLPIAVEEMVAKARAGAGGGQLILSMNGMDGEDHRLFRGIAQKEFLRPNIENMGAQIEQIAAEFVQRLIDKGPECDFVREIARWYPLRVIMSLLGVPAKDEALMLRLTEQLFGEADLDVQKDYGPPKGRKEVIGEFFDYFTVLLKDRRDNPRNDIASQIANAQIRGDLIGDFEALSYYVTIATAGHDTTAASIAGGLLALIQHPLEIEKLRANPELLTTAADEMVRWAAPVKHFFRTATADYELRGRKIKNGDSVMIAFASGSRDEDIFPDANVFRVDRKPNRHLSMGDGVHVCLGQHLARLEIRLFFKHFLARIASVEMAGDPAWVEGPFISGMKRLPIRFEASGAY